MLVFAILFSFATPVHAAGSSAYGCASSLYTLGLFKGTGSNSDGTPIFALDRAPTRAEAAVMLVRILGKEGEAKNGAYQHPFRDVEEWARPYVGYAYCKGLSNGTGESTYGSEETISASQFITLVLRALGYSSGKDFQWETSYKFSDIIGLTDGSYNANSQFTRGDTAIIMFSALSQKINGTGTTMLASLYQNGAVTLDAVKSIGLSSLVNVSIDNAELSPAQIYAKCSPAVFFITVYDKSGNSFGFGSGFFIDSSGTAVTNYHVIKDAKSASIKTTDGKVYKVLGIYSTDSVNDLAILQIDGSGFPYLETADSDLVKTGATVYAIGNPEGLESTISQGLISYTNRVVNGVSYLQTTAAISHGSSGGALIDTYGKVVGVTSAFFSEGQNLNLAVPINRARNMSRTTCAPFTSESSGSSSTSGTEKSYASCSSVPDFGSYFGVALYSSDKDVSTSGVTYYYNYKAADVAAVSSNALNDYISLLEKWGFSYENRYSSSSSTLAGDVYINSSGSIKVLVATQTSSNGNKYVTISVRVNSSSSGTKSSYPATETGYAEASKVPDFGVYFGVKPNSTSSTSDSYGNYYFYFYNQSDVSAADASAYSDYTKLLTKWGFTYKSAYKSSEGTSVGASYTNGSIIIIVANYSGSNEQSFDICIFVPYASNSIGIEKGYSYNSSVPDLGAYFSVNAYTTMSSDGMTMVLYKVSDVYAADSKAAANYISLLKEWGFSYSKSSSDSYLAGDFYEKGSTVVFFGLYKYLDSTYLTVIMN